ncbi:hypothetical protein A6764_15120 [Brevibacillus sp. WF146]|uniref:hypothetical protein n=1 Tax=Brevibacillus sp. WF146 TaxID=319501 RepID=UPI0007ECA847|nr:hypothetical protein [Brevibacillus sp. WF146]UYZ12156.1 hypothetical protein A6764_15120 [Brevibacillus sp. WF146]
MRRTKKSAYNCIAYLALKVKNSGIIQSLAAKCEREGATPEIAKIHSSLVYFVDEFPLDGFGKFPKCWTVAKYDDLYRELSEAYENAEAVLAEQTELPDLSAMTTVEAIVWYTREVARVSAIKPGTPGRTERMQALLAWKRALNERIDLEREYAAKLREICRYAGFRNAGNWFGLTYRSLRHSPDQRLRRVALRNAWRDFAEAGLTTSPRKCDNTL